MLMMQLAAGGIIQTTVAVASFVLFMVTHGLLGVLLPSVGHVVG